jgi:hypothetical protein
VLYQQDPFDFGFATTQPSRDHEGAESRLPQEVRGQRDPYGFIGRDGPILEMERALHRKAPAILLQGLSGVGKTTLARGFLHWLDDTGGLDGALWFDFRDIRTAEYVINRTGETLCGENFRLAPNKLELLARALNERRVVVVWDNFESASTNLTGEDRAELGRFLDAIRGCRSKAIRHQPVARRVARAGVAIRAAAARPGWRGAVGILRSDPAGSRIEGETGRPRA